MKSLPLILLTLTLLTACGAPEIPDMPELPNAEDIQKQVEQDLAKQGIDMPDLTAEDETASTGPALTLKAETKSTTFTDPTVKELWPEANAYAKAAFPGATLIGFNNFGPQLDDTYNIPGREFSNGKSNYWVYIFVHDAKDTADSKVDEKSEAFGVEFSNGKLSLVPVEINQEEVNTIDLFGEGLLATDTSTLADNAKKAVKEQFATDTFKHISFACRPMWPATFASGNGDCVLTLYVSQDTGFKVDVFNKTGAVQSVKQVDFMEL